jgi:transposase
VHLPAATPAESSLALAALDAPVTERQPERIIADKGHDACQPREAMTVRGVDLIAPHLRPRVNRYQDGRKLRRCRRCWIVERSSAWLLSFRRQAGRPERKLELLGAFIPLACAITARRQRSPPEGSPSRRSRSRF